MAIHRRIRKGARDALAHVRRGREALQRRRKGRRVARGADVEGIDQRLSSLAAHVLAGQHYECAWELFRFGQFKGLSHEAAALELADWARRQRITVAFEIRKVRNADVIFLLLTVG
jgi:hypothetical protein